MGGVLPGKQADPGLDLAAYRSGLNVSACLPRLHPHESASGSTCLDMEKWRVRPSETVSQLEREFDSGRIASNAAAKRRKITAHGASRG